MQELTQEEAKIYIGILVLLEVKVRIFWSSIKGNMRSSLRDKRDVRIARHGSFYIAGLGAFGDKRNWNWLHLNSILQIVLKQRRLSRSGRSSDKRPKYMPRGVLESYVIIARVTSLVAVHSEKSKCKVSKEPN